MSAPLSQPRYTRLRAQFELITPAFIGGVEHVCAGVDPKSIKATLRDWWRVLNAGHIAHDCSNPQALHALHQREMHLFGVEGGADGGGGQGLLHLALHSKMRDTCELELQPGIVYLLGQGLAKYNAHTKCSELLRKPLREHRFDLDLIFFQPGQAQPSSTEVDSVYQALLAFGLLGGLGSRKNRGFGSLTLLSIDNQKIAATRSTYLQALEALFARAHPQLPLLPSLSQHAQCRVLFAEAGISVPPATQKGHPLPVQRKVDNAMDLLNLVGEQFMLERSWGRHAPYSGQHETSGGYLAEQNYKFDHDFVKAACHAPDYPAPPANTVPLRSIYGLPYRFDKHNEMNLMLPGAPGQPATASRRASPFHIHLHKLEQKPLAVLFTLPSLFVPENLEIGMGQHVAARNSSQVQFDYSTIARFLKRFSSAHIIR